MAWTPPEATNLDAPRLNREKGPVLHEGFYKLAATVTRSGVCQKMGVGPFGKDQGGRLAGCEVCNPNLECENQGVPSSRHRWWHRCLRGCWNSSQVVLKKPGTRC